MTDAAIIPVPTQKPPLLKGHRRRALLRLIREAAWLRQAREAARNAPVDLTALQVLAVLALDSPATYEQTRARLGLTKAHLSRALRSLRSEGMIEAAPRQYFRHQLPAPTAAGLETLEALIDEIGAH